MHKYKYTDWDQIVLYITCAVQHLYIPVEMYGVVCILTMCSHSTGYFLYMTHVPIAHRIGT